MKNLKKIYLLAFALLLSLASYSQQRAVTNIEKNINDSAADLEQSINFTLDTLTLRHPDKILRVTILSHDEKDSIIIDVASEEVRIPLYHLKRGRDTFSVQTAEQMILVGANRLSNIPVPEGAITDLEESILRSSLSEEEQRNRNIKPLKKKLPITNDNDTRVASAKPKRDIKVKKKDRITATKKKVTKPKKDDRVAAVKKKVPKPKKKDRVAVVKTKKASKPKRAAKKRPNAGKKSGFALALEKEKKKAAEKKFTSVKRKKEGEKIVVTEEEKSKGTLLVVTKVTYNLTDKSGNKTIKKQSRADYRANNLRPNGTPYEN